MEKEGKMPRDLKSEIVNMADVLNKGLPAVWKLQHPNKEVPGYEAQAHLNSGYPHVEVDIDGKKCDVEPDARRGMVWLYGLWKAEVGACLEKAGYCVVN